MVNISKIRFSILFIVISLSLKGCSFIEKSSYFENYSYNQWQREYYYSIGRNAYFLNKFETEDYTIYIIPRRLQSSRILFGPAYFLPFIPNIFHFWPESSTRRYAEDFHIQIIIKNKIDKIITDLSKIIFEFDEEIYNPKTKKVDVYSALALNDSLPDKKYFHSWWVDSIKSNYDSLHCLKVIEFKETKLIAEREYIAIQYEFDYETIRIDEIQISFDNFILETKNKDIPILRLNSENYYEYIPFEFGH